MGAWLTAVEAVDIDVGVDLDEVDEDVWVVGVVRSLVVVFIVLDDVVGVVLCVVNFVVVGLVVVVWLVVVVGLVVVDEDEVGLDVGDDEIDCMRVTHW